MDIRKYGNISVIYDRFGNPVICNARKDKSHIKTRYKSLLLKKANKERMAPLPTFRSGELTIRQRNALKFYFTGMNMKEAGIAAGYNPGTAGGSVSRILKSEPGNAALVQAMEKAGITDDRIAEVINEGLEAKHPFKPKQKDFHAIDKFVDKAIKIKGQYAPTKIQQQGEHRHVHIHLNKEDDIQADKFAKMRGIPIEAEVIPES